MSRHTVALSPNLQLGPFLSSLVDQEHNLVKLLLRHLRSSNFVEAGFSHLSSVSLISLPLRHWLTMHGGATAANLGSLLCARLEGVAYSALPSGLRSLLHKLIVDALVDEGPGPSCAALACNWPGG